MRRAFLKTKEGLAVRMHSWAWCVGYHKTLKQTRQMGIDSFLNKFVFLCLRQLALVKQKTFSPHTETHSYCIILLLKEEKGWRSTQDQLAMGQLLLLLLEQSGTEAVKCKLTKLRHSRLKSQERVCDDGIRVRGARGLAWTVAWQPRWKWRRIQTMRTGSFDLITG